MRIEILAPATWHSITEDEIRTVVNYYELRIGIASRLPAHIATDTYLQIGRAADNQPHIELIADTINPDVTIVFHAMMLRPVTVANLNLETYGLLPEYAPQRLYIGP